MKKFLILLFLLSSVLVVTQSFAKDFLVQEKQYIETKVNQSTSTKIMCGAKLRCGSNLVAKFYRRHDFNPVWIDEDKPSANALEFITVIRNAYQDGLNPNAYHLQQIDQLLQTINDDGPTANLLASLDMLLSDAFFLYANNLSNGLINSKTVFPYWTINKPPLNLIGLLDKALNNDNIADTLANLAPKYPGYAKLKEKLAEYRQVALHNPWPIIPKGPDLQLGSSGERVKLLQRRLLISGELSKINSKGKFNKDVEQAVIMFQENNGLFDDGVVDKDTLRVLNLSVETRIRQIELNMDKMRWLPQDLGDEYIMVNIPDYSLNVMNNGTSALSMDVAVGGTDHPSCVLNSKIVYLVLNPVWNIPTNIADAELLPQIRKNPAYLTKKGVEVLRKNESGNYVPIKATNINWSTISMKDFNQYRFRQAPGKLNALGKVKFIFPNPCQIYLHDSIESEIFEVYRRDFSHGCIRVGEPMALTNYILNQEKDWSPDDIQQILDTEKNKVVFLPNPINLYLVYFTAWVGADGWIQFRNDIYHFDKLAKYPVYLPEQVESSDD